MNPAQLLPWIAVLLIIARWAAESWLARLNERHVLAHAGAIPDAFKGVMDDATYEKSVRYTLAGSRFGKIENAFDAALLALILCTGCLPWASREFTASFGVSDASWAAFLLAIGFALALPGLPFEWYHQFRLEQHFGFNTTTPRTWWTDRVKGAAIAIVLGFPLLWLVLRLVHGAGIWWWVWGWAILMAFQLLMLVLAPMVILPLFNKLSPLAEGSLRDRLLNLGRRTGFSARSIQVMDGSRRSRHSNAFFTGFGRFRRIVLFDTLIQQLTEPELEAVLAHEIGHYKKGHIPRMLALSALGALAGFYVISLLGRQAWFYRGFGFDYDPARLGPAFLIFALLAGTVTFWLSPLANWWSRRFEYEADAYAARAVGEARSLIGALRKLTERNLGNLTPHPLYSRFHYSHPTLLEREQALAGLRPNNGICAAGKD
jgi:STE24 endopeptidase